MSFITIDPYYDVNFYNQCKESLKNNKIEFTEFLEIKKIEKYIPSFFAIIAIFAILEASLFFIKPNFLAYASEILPKNFIVNLKGMGEGSYETAQYLNQLPNASNMIIWSDKGAVCERFVGKCFVDFKTTNSESTSFLS